VLVIPMPGKKGSTASFQYINHKNTLCVCVHIYIKPTTTTAHIYATEVIHNNFRQFDEMFVSFFMVAKYLFGMLEMFKFKSQTCLSKMTTTSFVTCSGFI
jgi:hypothetical protein